MLYANFSFSSNFSNFFFFFFFLLNVRARLVARTRAHAARSPTQHVHYARARACVYAHARIPLLLSASFPPLPPFFLFPFFPFFPKILSRQSMPRATLLPSIPFYFPLTVWSNYFLKIQDSFVATPYKRSIRDVQRDEFQQNLCHSRFVRRPK